MNRPILLGLLTALLAACATTPEEARAYAEREANRLKAAHGQTCEKLGYKPETNEWRDCLLDLENQRIMQQQMLMDRSYWHFPGFAPYYYRPGCCRSGGRIVCY